MKYVYPACFYGETDGRYSVVMPDFPLATYGDSLADAMYMASDAATERIMLMLENGESLPRPSNLIDVMPEQSDGFVSLVYIDTEQFQHNYEIKSVKKTLTIPSWLKSGGGKKACQFLRHSERRAA